jgi:transcriptional regulator with XRE-family HTH domain
MTNKNHGVDDAYIRNRITELRKRMDVSEHKMSLDLGKSKGYIHNIATARSSVLPSVTELLRICDYLGVTPKQFFDVQAKLPLNNSVGDSLVKKQAIGKIQNLNDDEVKAVLPVLAAIGSKEESVKD